MKTVEKLVPELRFPGFEGEWESNSINEITILVDSLHQTPKNYAKNGYPMIRVTDVNNKSLDLKTCIKVTKNVYKEFTKKYCPQKDDIILARVGTCGSTIMLINDEKVCLGQNTVLLRSKINPYYQHLYIRSNYFQDQINKKIVGSTQKTLSLKDLKKMKIPTPTFPEQQKIAAFLSGVDKKIEHLSRKKELLQTYKKGLMQKIFSREIRFEDDDGKDFPDWEEKRLGEVLKVIDGDRGKNYPNNSDFYESEFCLFLNAKNVTKKGFSFEETSFITKGKDTILRKGKLKRNDIVLTTRGTVGNIAFYNDLIKYSNMRINSGMVLLRNENETIDSQYVYLFFYSHIMTNQIKKIAFGSAQPQLTVNEINKFKLPIPSLPEQQKIASFLSNLDKKIEAVDNQLNQIKTFKKGLLQKMFV